MKKVNFSINVRESGRSGKKILNVLESFFIALVISLFSLQKYFGVKENIYETFITKKHLIVTRTTFYQFLKNKTNGSCSPL